MDKIAVSELLESNINEHGIHHFKRSHRGLDIIIPSAITCYHAHY